MFCKLFSFLLLISSAMGRPNFLFIIVDDLRPALGCYGDKNAYTPNIDALSKKSIIFTQAFAQQSLCAPSRNSILTGRRPDTLHLYDFYSYWRKDVGNFTTLPQHLKNNGYITMSIGKVFHPGISSNCSDDSPYSWTEKPFHPFTDRYKDAPICQNNVNESSAKNLICPVQLSLIPNNTLPDIESLNAAKSFLQSHAQKISPFFLAVGFQKPHIPLKYPKEFIKYHPLDKFSVPENYEWPINVSSVAYNPWTDLRIREDVKALHLKFPWEKIPFNFAKRIIQSYYAAVTYIDHLIGRLLEELRKHKLKENTVIILTSDHGWSLGEHSEWAKYSNFEVALKVPLLVSIPYTIRNQQIALKYLNGSQKNSVSIKRKYCNRRNELVELVDLFPTIADLADIPIQTCHNLAEGTESNLCSEGYSMLPLIEASKDCKKLSWKKAAFSQYPRPGIEPTLNPNSDKPHLKEINIMGYTIRTKRFRYNAWTSFSSDNFQPNWKTILAEELYDHMSDPSETRNQILLPEFDKIKKRLRKLLQAGWREALPNYKDGNYTNFEIH